MVEVDLPTIQHLLTQLGPVQLAIGEYRMTHGYLHVQIADTSFRRVAELYLTDCSYICGPTEGGPYHLHLKLSHEGGEEALELSTTPSGLLVRALRAAFSATAMRATFG